ncbi:MAG: hypothetical protein NC541_15300 [bacterium]|nr:hypothetical protein [bacterium]
MYKKHYIKLVCRIKDRQYVEKHYDGRYGAPGMSREKRGKATPEQMAKQNLWRRTRDLTRLIEYNFGPGDWHVVLPCYPGQRPAAEEAPKVIRDFWKKLRAEYKRQGWELKIVLTCETGTRGAVHWHAVINDRHNDSTSTAKLIRKLWTRGRPYFTALDESGDYGALAEYIVKETAKRVRKGETGEKLSYMRSRNLVKPPVRREKVEAGSWRKEPKAPSGWEVVKGSVVNGTNPYTGQPYQYYTLRRLESAGKAGREEEKGEMGRHLHRDRHPGPGKGDGAEHVPDVL